MNKEQLRHDHLIKIQQLKKERDRITRQLAIINSKIDGEISLLMFKLITESPDVAPGSILNKALDA